MKTLWSLRWQFRLMAKKRGPGWVAAGLLLAATASVGRGTVIDYESYVLANSGTNGIRNFYTFAGTIVSQRQADKAGSANLSAVQFGTGSTGSIQYPAGFTVGGVSSAALKPQAIGTANGAALGITTNSFAWPTGSFTIETILQPDATYAARGFAVGALPGTVGLSYDSSRIFLVQQTSNDIDVYAGTGSFAEANRTVVDNYPNPAPWYYVAVTYQNSGSDVVVNAWSANLSANGSLTQTVTNQSLPGNYLSFARPLGIGMAFDSTQPFPGLIDSVAIYSGSLAVPVMEANLAQIYVVPEPSQGMLGGLAILCAAAIKRAARGR